jgi:hypothetical protein
MSVTLALRSINNLASDKSCSILLIAFPFDDFFDTSDALRNIMLNLKREQFEAGDCVLINGVSSRADGAMDDGGAIFDGVQLVNNIDQVVHWQVSFRWWCVPVRYMVEACID